MITRETKSGYKIIPVLTRRSNVFLLTNGKQNILVDTSVKSEWRKLEKRLKDLEISHIDCLILTHTHFDHAGNAFNIKRKFNPKVFVQKSGEEFLSSGDNIIPEGTNIFTRTLLFLFAKKVFPKLRYAPCDNDLLVDSFLDLKEFGFNAYIISTPGHTADSVSIVVDDEIAFVGDTMFGVFKWSVLPPYANDVEEIIKSWGLLLETNCSLFVPSHGTANSRKLVQKNYDKLNGKKFK
jgi:hydroxyacylglutathione hydrolase